MPHPKSITQCAEIIVDLLTDAPIIQFGIQEKDAAEKSQVFQRCLSNLMSYQPAKLYSVLETKCPSLTLIDSPFVSNDLSFVSSKDGFGFLKELLGNSDMAGVKEWLKSNKALKPSTRVLLQRLIYLKLYLTSKCEKAEGEINNDLTIHQKAAWEQRNLRYPIVARSVPESKEFHLLTLYINNAVEKERLKKAVSLASSPKRDAKTLGRLLASSIFTCIEFKNRNLLHFYPGNLAFVAQFGSVVPISWYTADFMDSLFSRFSEEIEIFDSKSIAIIANTLKIWSYWARRADISLSKTTSHKIQGFIEAATKKILLPETRESFEKTDLRTCIQSIIIITPKLLGPTGSKIEADGKEVKFLVDILNSGILNHMGEKPKMENTPEAHMGDVIQAAVATGLQNGTSDSQKLIEAYLSNQAQLSLHLNSLPENSLLEQGMKVFNLSQFHICQLPKSGKKRVSDPYAWAPFTTLPYQLFMDDSSSMSSLFALGGSYSGLRTIPSKNQPSFRKEIEECFLASVGHQLAKFDDSCSLTDPIWSALAIVLGRCVDESNFAESIKLFSASLRPFMTQFFVLLVGQYSPVCSGEEYTALSESPLFRETGRIAKLLGRILVSHLDSEGIQAYSGIQTLLSLLSSGPQASLSSVQEKFQLNLSSLRKLAVFSSKFHTDWDEHFPTNDTKEGLRKCLRSTLFAYTLILQVIIMRPSTVTEASDLEVELALTSLYNIHFALVIQTPRVMFNGHNDVCTKLFSLASERPHLMANLLKELDPYNEIREKLLAQEILPEEPTTSFTFQSKELFYFWFLEHTMSKLTGEQVEKFVLPLIRVYLSSRQPWSQDLFESAHSIVLAMFRNINHPILGKFAKWYQHQLLLQYPKWLTTDQFRIAYTLMVEGLARQEEIGGHAVWALIRHVGDLVPSNLSSPETIPGYFQTFVKLLPSVPITYLPAFTNRIETLALSLSSPKSGGLALEAAAKLVFDTVSQESLSTTHKTFAVPWYLKFLKLTSPPCNTESKILAER